MQGNAGLKFMGSELVKGWARHFALGLGTL